MMMLSEQVFSFLRIKPKPILEVKNCEQDTHPDTFAKYSGILTLI